MRIDGKFKYLLMAVLSLTAVLVTGVSTFAWFQINVPASRSTTVTNDTSSITVNSVTGYKYEYDQTTSSTVDYNNGSAAAVNYIGTPTDNNIQEGETTTLDLPTEGMGFYLLNSAYDYKLANGVKMDSISGDSYARLQSYSVNAGETIKFINHSTDNSGNTIDYPYIVLNVFSYDSTTTSLIGSEIVLNTGPGTISFANAGTYYICVKNDGRIELTKKSGSGRLAKLPSPQKRTIESGTTVYLTSNGNDSDWSKDSANVYMWYWEEGWAGDWGQFKTTTSYKYGGRNVYSCTITHDFDKYILIRGPNWNDWNTLWNRSASDGSHSLWGSGNILVTTSIRDENTDYACYFLSSVKEFDGYYIEGESGADSSTFGTGSFSADEAILMDPGAENNDKAKKSGLSLNSGDKFRIRKRYGQNDSSTTYKYSVTDTNPSAVKSRMIKDDGGGNIEMKESASVSIFLTEGYRINIYFGAAAYTLTLITSQFDSTGAISEAGTETFTAISGESITEDRLSSLVTNVSNYTKQSGWYTNSECTSTQTVPFTINAATTVYAKIQENTISVTLTQKFSDGQTGSTKSVSFGAATTYSASQIKTKSGWEDTVTHNTYSYSYSCIQNSNGTTFTNGTLTSGATYYVYYIPTQFAITKKIVFYNETGSSLTGKSEISLGSTDVNSTDLISTNDPTGSLSASDKRDTFGYEFDDWYYNGSKYTSSCPTTAMTLEARFNKLPSETIYFDISETVTHKSFENANWQRGMDLYIYADYQTASSVTIENSDSSIGNEVLGFGVTATPVFQFVYKMELPVKSSIVISCGYKNGNNQTATIELNSASGLQAGNTRIYTGRDEIDSTYHNVWSGWSSAFPTEIDPGSSSLIASGDNYFLHMYSADTPILFTSENKLVTGYAEGHETTDLAHKLQLPISAGSQFTFTRVNSNNPTQTAQFFNYEAVGPNQGSYLEQGDQIGNTTAFAKSLSTYSTTIDSTLSNQHLFKINTTGIYDIFINAEGRIYFTLCELKLNYKMPSDGEYTSVDMHLGDGTVKYCVHEAGVDLEENMLVYVSVLSNQVTRNFGWADLNDSDQSAGFAERAAGEYADKVKIDDPNVEVIRITKAARYATEVRNVNSTLKIYLFDMPEKGAGYYICQSDAGFYSFGKSIKMREINTPSSYKYQYKDYVVTRNSETIKLKGYSNYTVQKVETLSSKPNTVSISSGTITLPRGIYDIYINADDLSSACIVSKGTADFFSLNKYNSDAANQDEIKTQNTCIVFKVSVTYNCNYGKTIKFKLGGSSPAKFGMKCSEIGAIYENPYEDARTNLYDGALTSGTTAISVGNVASTSGANQSATFYVLVDYLYGGGASSSDSFKLIVSLAEQS